MGIFRHRSRRYFRNFFGLFVFTAYFCRCFIRQNWFPLSHNNCFSSANFRLWWLRRSAYLFGKRRVGHLWHDYYFFRTQRKLFTLVDSAGSCINCDWGLIYKSSDIRHSGSRNHFRNTCQWICRILHDGEYRSLYRKNSCRSAS